MDQRTELPENITGKDLIAHLLEQKKVPENGLDTITIEYLLLYLSSLDSNNFLNKACVGEREGRCFSDLVAKRNFYFTHGIGRSGDLAEPQPKAIGSSILYKLTNILLNDLMSVYNLNLKCLLAPIPIGISLILCLSTFRLERTLSEYVIWFREDNEIIFKAIVNGGFIPIILSSQPGAAENGFQLLQKKINDIGVEKVNCVISTTACTLPRGSDDISKILKVCQSYLIPHIVINDCGLQSKNVMSSIRKTHEDGEVDVILHNAGENLLVPVGSTLITSCNSSIIEKISKTYPGRASSSSTIDILITLLSLGKQGYIKLLDDREYIFQYFWDKLLQLKGKYEHLITKVDSNFTSIVISFSSNAENLTELQELLVNSCSIKLHLVTNREDKVVLGYKFEGWGTHGVDFTNPFLVFQLSLYVSQKEIDNLLQKLELCLNKLQI